MAQKGPQKEKILCFDSLLKLFSKALNRPQRNYSERIERKGSTKESTDNKKEKKNKQIRTKKAFSF